MLGIEHPLLAGGLQWLANADYVAAVVNAGGMGFVTWKSSPSIEHIRAELRRCNKLTGGRPFGVNLSLSSQRTNNAGMAEAIKVSLAEGVRIFETVAHGSPATLIEALHEGGAIVFHKSSSLKHAMSAERHGADIIGLVGHEEGGHPGDNDLSTFTMCAAASRTITKPLVMGGGIGTGEQILGILGVGADGVVMGSRLLVATENWAHDDYKRTIAGLDPTCSTTVFRSNLALNGTWRVLNNDTVTEIQARERAGKREFADFADLIRGSIARDLAYKNGDCRLGMISLGPAAGFCNQIEPMEAIFERLLMEAATAEQRIAALTAVPGSQTAAG